MFIQTLFTSPLYFLMVCLILVFSICLHEYCHAWIACREGDLGAADYMTLNPLRQMGFMSLLMMAIIGIAWGVVPVNSSVLRSRWSLLRVSLAGPAANLLLFLIAAAVFMGMGFWSAKSNPDLKALPALVQFFFHFGIYNFALLAFNLIPAPGLDGWNILSELFPRMRQLSSEVAKGVMLLLLLVAFIGVPYLFRAGAWLMMQVLYLGIRMGGGA